MSHDIGRKLVAEFVGTFALIFIGAGSIVAAYIVGGGDAGTSLVTIALAHGFVIAVMVSAVGHVSGGHFNPAVTIGAWTTAKIRGGDAVAYLGTQLLAGVAGALLLRATVPEEAWRGVSLGATLIGDVGVAQAVAIEAVLTFFLVWVIFAVAVDPEGTFRAVAGLPIGLTVALDIMMGGPLTGASMNPARSLGPAVAGGFWTDHWVYWVGPVAGGIIAAVLYDLLVLRRRHPEPTLEEAP